MDKPRFLIWSELQNEYICNLDEIKKVKNNITNDNYKMTFIYSYSLFEGALNQMAKSICYAFPEKAMNEDSVNSIKPEKLLEFIQDEFGIEKLVDYRLLKIGKNDLLDILKSYGKIYDIDIEKLDSFDKEKLIKISRARNNLVHSHSLHKSSEYHKKPTNNYISINEAINYLDYILKLMTDILDATKNQYLSFTLEKLFEASVKYTLGDCRGYKFYCIEDNKYTLNIENCKILAKVLSSGERQVLGWWLYQYSDTMPMTCEINILDSYVFLDDKTQAKIKFLKDLARRFPYLLDGQKLN